MKKHTGFSLIELMLMLAIVGIVVAFGMPKITGVLENNRIVTYVNLLSANLSYARSESVKRGVQVLVISNSGDNNWLNGWTVYIDADNNNAVTAGEELRIVDPLGLKNTTLTGPPGNVIYSPDGSVNAVTSFQFNSAGMYPTRDVNITITGKVDIVVTY
ncbi:MAG: GspH/FimT family pseudopilin [Gammaproteobacteria bacterium]|nr:GspH/FimT family pseudopilin [Gammaproteobacteria bacterium]MDH5651154.1 GspH/FimT family pseudopilin [Gammaproteobacteria bacterium]